MILYMESDVIIMNIYIFYFLIGCFIICWGIVYIILEINFILIVKVLKLNNDIKEI